ncbi:MAG TPA: hypothetical protein VHM89_07385 [Acidimicrobiales bacterium]|nr:hypothetical protein [Acidimicrobiales bacterium]
MAAKPVVGGIRAASGRRRPVRGWVAGVGVAAVLLVATSTAFACSPRCCFASLVQTAGPTKSEVTVRGTMFGSLRAEVRWGSATGQLLANATGDAWTRTITIPEEAPDFYAVVVQGIDPTGAVVDSTAPTFHVTGASSDTATSPTTIPPTIEPPSGEASPTSSPNAVPVPGVEPISAPLAAEPAPSSAGALVVAPTRGPSTPPTTTRVVTPGARTTGRSPVGAPSAGLAQPVAAAVPVPVTPVAGAGQQGAPQDSVADASTADGAAQALPHPWPDRQAAAHGVLDEPARHEAPLRIGLVLLGIGLIGLFGGLTAQVLRRSASRENMPTGH